MMVPTVFHLHSFLFNSNSPKLEFDMFLLLGLQSGLC